MLHTNTELVIGNYINIAKRTHGLAIKGQNNNAKKLFNNDFNNDFVELIAGRIPDSGIPGFLLLMLLLMGFDLGLFPDSRRLVSRARRIPQE